MFGSTRTSQAAMKKFNSQIEQRPHYSTIVDICTELLSKLGISRFGLKIDDFFYATEHFVAVSPQVFPISLEDKTVGTLLFEQAEKLDANIHREIDLMRPYLTTAINMIRYFTMSASLSQKILTTAEEERSKLTTIFHNGHLASMELLIANMKDSPESEVLKHFIAQWKNVSKDFRRKLKELIPPEYESTPIKELLMAEINRFSQAHPHIQLKKDIKIESELAELKEFNNAVIQILKEALNNVSKHSKATHVQVVTITKEDKFLLRVTDNGIGFDPIQKISSIGLRGLYFWANYMGAMLNIESEHGDGTTVYLEKAIKGREAWGRVEKYREPIHQTKLDPSPELGSVDMSV